MMHNDSLNLTGPNGMLFSGQTHVRRRTIILVAGAHWRLLIDAIEPSMCGGDAALRQITLTTCYCYFQKSVLLKPHKTYVVIVNRCYQLHTLCLKKGSPIF